MLKVVKENKITTITISRPEAKNAFNAELISELTEAFKKVSEDKDTRVVVLTGEEGIFSAGADINYMKSLGQMSEAENKEDALRLSTLFRSVSECKKPVIAKVNGSAFGGGVGLISACDLVISLKSAKFSFSEVRLGIVPATISPFVLRKIGFANAKVYFQSGSVFTGDLAKSIDLVNEVADDLDELNERVSFWSQEFLKAAPEAVASSKILIDTVMADLFSENTYEYTAELISKTRSGAEAQEGLSAFLEKRKPNWLNN
jgi:methylglutaconyl-CoA hydratase